MNWRGIPHPHYGNWGGGTNTSKDCPPVDPMDHAFMVHDALLSDSTCSQDRREADRLLIYDLKKVKNKSLAFPIYGRLYKWGALFVFSIVVRTKLT